MARWFGGLWEGVVGMVFFSYDQSEADDQDRRTIRPKSPHQGEGKLNLEY